MSEQDNLKSCGKVLMTYWALNVLEQEKHDKSYTYSNQDQNWDHSKYLSGPLCHDVGVVFYLIKFCA